MNNVAFAAVLATALMAFFASTRPLAAVGVFVLVCIKPLLGALMIAAALGYLLVSRRTAALTKLLPPSSGSNRNRGNALLSLLLLILVGGALALLLVEPSGEALYERLPSLVRSAPSEEVVVLRPPRSLLEVSRIEAVEMIDTRYTHSVLGVAVGETMPRIRVPAVYRYCVELGDELRVLRTDRIFAVSVPAPKPSLPVAVDFAGIEKDIAGTWALLPVVGDEDLDALELSVSKKLAEKARSHDYLERQRETARVSVRAFVRSYIVDQTHWKDARFADIRVHFNDEAAGLLARLAD